MTVPHSTHFAVAPRISRRLFGCNSQRVLLAVLLAALASTPCLAETVSMDHNTFIPGEITVAPGTTVTWVNNEAMPHTVVAPSQGFRSKTLVKDAQFSFTFTTPGDYDYLCSIHPSMKGKVIVKPGAG